MDRPRILYSGHALRQMLRRGIRVQWVSSVIVRGETVATYPDDRPYPSRLKLGFVDGQPIHVVVAYDATTHTSIVVTAYRPDPGLWGADFRTRSGC